MTRCRKDYRNLSVEERDRFVAALYHLKSTGVIDAFAQQHDDLFGPIHGGSNFGPWHREFLRRFEDQLRAYDSRITIPYWNWIEDRSTSSLLWSNSFLGQFDAAWGLNRALGSDTLPDLGTVDTVLNTTPFLTFTDRLEVDAHNAPHRWVAGTMVQRDSPGDPVFYLHHCFVDLLWAQWRILHPSEPFQPSGGAGGVAVDQAMPGFSTTPGDVLDHRTINVYQMPSEFQADPPSVAPDPATVVFNDVPAGELAFRPARFAMQGCGQVTFRRVAGPNLISGPPESVFDVIDPEVATFPEVDPTGRFWLSFRGTSPGDEATGDITIRCVETGEDFVFALSATTIERATTAVVLALDQSNSMNRESGIGDNTRGQVLQFSAPPFVDVIVDDNEVAVYSFDHDPHPGIGLTPVGGGGRALINARIAGYASNPDGWTSIGEAVAFGHDLLAPVTAHPIKAMVVLTDGKEQHGDYDRRYISDVADLINERVYAIGLGRAEAIEPAALRALCDGNEGYLLLTGDLNQDAYFLLAKYYQQILAGVTNQQMVRDPEGWLKPGEKHRIDFALNEADVTANAVLLTPAPYAIRFALETPAGDIIDPGVAGGNPAVAFGAGREVAYYRTALPVPVPAGEAQAGRWYGLLELEERAFKRYLGTLDNYPAELQRARTHGLRYNFSVHAYTALRMHARLDQTGFEPGATLQLSVRLEEGSFPIRSAMVRAELERPDGSAALLTLARTGEGMFTIDVAAPAPGIYRFQVRAEGLTVHLKPFTREQTVTGAVWRGGDDRPPSQSDDPRHDRERWCRLVRCILGQKGVLERLKREGIDIEGVLKCIEQFCAKRPPARRDPRQRLAARLDELLREPALVRELMAAIERSERHHSDN